MVNLRPYLKIARSSAVLAVVMILLLGFVIPSITALISETVDPQGSYGSPIKIDGKIYGSYLLAQAFDNKSFFFQSRPSTISFNQTESGACQGTSDSQQALNFTLQALKKFEKQNPGVNISSIPFSMIAYSASGLDPNIPFQGAIIQIPRIATNLSVLFNGTISSATFENILLNLTSADRQQNFPIFGSYYVNTMSLNVDIIDLMIKYNIIPTSLLN
ncbi:MAG: potassium-transporting ATPase subunit C [Thermoplasmataceae archaeon]